MDVNVLADNWSVLVLAATLIAAWVRNEQLSKVTAKAVDLLSQKVGLQNGRVADLENWKAYLRGIADSAAAERARDDRLRSEATIDALRRDNRLRDEAAADAGLRDNRLRDEASTDTTVRDDRGYHVSLKPTDLKPTDDEKPK